VSDDDQIPEQPEERALTTKVTVGGWADSSRGPKGRELDLISPGSQKFCPMPCDPGRRRVTIPVTAATGNRLRSTRGVPESKRKTPR
jgi:hypothetical protein